MGQAYRFLKLPRAVQQAVIDRLEANGGADYEQIEADLRADGHRISASGIHRYFMALRGDGEFLRRWAAEHPQQAAALVAAIKVSPAGGIRLSLPAKKAGGGK